MVSNRLFGGIKAFGAIAISLGLIGCGGLPGASEAEKQRVVFDSDTGEFVPANPEFSRRRGSLRELFSAPDENVSVRVNKFIWNAALETLSFLPLETVDPFTGVLVFGAGRAPGSAQTYRATVLVQDPALEARSLKVSVQTQRGPASAETNRRIEDAILTRARQLRARQKRL